MKKYIYILLIAMLMVGCEKNDTSMENGEVKPVDLILSYATPPANNTTYRVMCYDENNENYIGTGTYRYDPAHSRSMVPCAVDAAGVPTTDGSDNALLFLYAGNTSSCDHLESLPNEKYLTIVSPAKSFTAGTFNTFSLSRSTPFWATSPTVWRTDGYRIIDLGENLKDVRSRVAFSFYSGANVSSAITVGNLTLTDAGSTAEWVPNTRAITIGGADPTVTMRAATTTEKANESNLLYVNKNTEYVFASTYGMNGVKPIKVKFKLTIGSKISNESYILAQDMEKMKYYKFNFTVTSEQITLQLQVYDLGGNNHAWQDGITDSGTLGNPESTLTLGTWTIGNNWVNGGGGTGSID